MNMSLIYQVLFVLHGFKNSSSLALLPQIDFAVFERQFLFEYYTQRAKFRHVLNSTSSLAAWSQLHLKCFLLYAKPYANEQNCKQ